MNPWRPSLSTAMSPGQIDRLAVLIPRLSIGAPAGNAAGRELGIMPLHSGPLRRCRGQASDRSSPGWVGQHFPRGADLFRRQLSRPSALAPAGAGRRKTSKRALPDYIPLIFGQCRADMEQEPALGGPSCRTHRIGFRTDLTQENRIPANRQTNHQQKIFARRRSVQMCSRPSAY